MKKSKSDCTIHKAVKIHDRSLISSDGLYLDDTELDKLCDCDKEEFEDEMFIKKNFENISKKKTKLVQFIKK